MLDHHQNELFKQERLRKVREKQLAKLLLTVPIVVSAHHARHGLYASRAVESNTLPSVTVTKSS